MDLNTLEHTVLDNVRKGLTALEPIVLDNVRMDLNPHLENPILDKSWIKVQTSHILNLQIIDLTSS